MYSSETQITNNINELQSDILLEDTSKNSIFKASAISSRNKALKTEKKTVVHAINEVQQTAANAKSTLENNFNYVFGVLGDVVVNQELKQKVFEIAPNIPTALEVINQELSRVALFAKDDYEDKFMVGENPQSIFQLTYTPIGKLRLYINGSYYSRQHFTYDEETNSVTWDFTEANGGFDITDSEVIFEYDYDPDEETQV